MRINYQGEMQDIPSAGPLDEWAYYTLGESALGHDGPTIIEMAKNNGIQVPQHLLDTVPPPGYVGEAAWKGFTKPEHLRAIQDSAITLPGGGRAIPESVWNAIQSAEDAYSGNIVENGPLQLFGGLGSVLGAQALGFGAGGAAGDAAAWGVNPRALDWAAIDAGTAVAPWSTNPSLAALGGEVGGASSLSDFFNQLQQNKTIGPGGGLDTLFNNLDGTGAGLTGIGANTLLQGAGAGSSLISKLMSGDASASDYASLAGLLGQTGLGIASGLQQSNATDDLGARILNMGAPSLARYEASFAPGFDLWQQPGYKDALDASWDSALRKLSAQGGNPFGNPGGLIEANKATTAGLTIPATQNYREINRAAGFGNVPQYAQLASNAIGQQGGAWEAAGAGLESLLRPRQPQLNLNLGQFLG